MIGLTFRPRTESSKPASSEREERPSSYQASRELAEAVYRPAPAALAAGLSLTITRVERAPYSPEAYSLIGSGAMFGELGIGAGLDADGLYRAEVEERITASPRHEGIEYRLIERRYTWRELEYRERAEGEPAAAGELAALEPFSEEWLEEVSRRITSRVSARLSAEVSSMLLTMGRGERSAR